MKAKILQAILLLVFSYLSALSHPAEIKMSRTDLLLGADFENEETEIKRMVKKTKGNNIIFFIILEILFINKENKILKININFGSPGRARTSDRSVNSRLLYHWATEEHNLAVNKKKKKKQVKFGGSERNRTAVQGFAGPYITTLPPSQIFWTINLLLTSSQLINTIRLQNK